MNSNDRDRLVARLPEPAPTSAERVSTRGRPQVGPLPGGDFGAERDTDEPLPSSAILARAPELRTPRPPVSIDPTRSAPTSSTAFYETIVFECADRLAMLARHRDERPLAARASTEERLLAQVDAVLATGPGALRDLEAYWQARREDGDPYKIWPIVLTLASLESPKALLAIERVVEGLPADAVELGLRAADALVACAHPHWAPLAEDLLASPHPLARLVGIEVLSRREAPAPERIDALLEDASACVRAAAIRALARRSDTTRLLGLAKLLENSDSDVAYEAARAMTLHGSRAALEALRDGAALARTLTPRRHVELFALAGSLDDLPHLQTVISGARMSPGLLRAIARIGSAATWSFLLHYLSDEELGRAAAEALTTLFGERVRGRAARVPAAWREAIAEGGFDPSVRYRHGEPWSAEIVAAECRSGTLSRAEVEHRLDELRVRSNGSVPIDLGAFWPDLAPRLDALGNAHGGRA